MSYKQFTSTLVTPADVNFAVAVRIYTFTILREILGLNHKVSYRLQQVVDELFINAVRYGSKEGEKVWLTYAVKNDILSIDVEDSGTGLYPIKAEKLLHHIEKGKEHFKTLKEENKIYQALSGRGIAEIITHWVDKLDITDREEGGLKISVQKNLNNVKE